MLAYRSITLSLFIFLCCSLFSPVFSFDSPAPSKSSKSLDSPQFPPLDSVTLKIEELLESSTQWTPRGNVEIIFGGSGRPGIKFLDDPQALSASARHEAFKRLVRSANNAVYKIRLTQDSQSPVMAYLPAISLAAADFQEHFLFHFDVFGHFLSVDYTATGKNSLNGKTEREQAEQVLSSGTSFSFRPRAKLSLGRSGEKPQMVRMRHYQPAGGAPVDPQTGMPVPEKKAEPEKGFFEKYWMYIVPFGILMIINGATTPPPEKK